MLKFIVFLVWCVIIDWVFDIIMDVNDVLMVILMRVFDGGVKNGKIVRRVGMIINFLLLLNRFVVIFVMVLVIYKVIINYSSFIFICFLFCMK